MAPVQKLATDSVKWIEQIGRDDMGKGIEMTVPNSNITETRQLQEAHRDMIIQQQQKQALVAAEAASAAAAAASAPWSSQPGSNNNNNNDHHIPYALPAYASGKPFDMEALWPVSASAPPGGVIFPAPDAPPAYDDEIHHVRVHVHTP